MNIRGLKRIIIWTFVVLLVFSNFVFIFQKQAKAASSSFSMPGKWYIDSNTGNLVNRIEMSRNGTTETVNWEYISSTGKGELIQAVSFGNVYENVAAYKLTNPSDLISQENRAIYYVFVQQDGQTQQVLDVGIYVSEAPVDYTWKVDQNSPDFSRIRKAHGGADTPLGQYLEQLSARLANQPIILATAPAPTGLTSESKKACQDLLIKPLSSYSGGNPINDLFHDINKKMGQTVLQDISKQQDEDLYQKFFKRDPDVDFSNAYIDEVTSDTYRDFVNNFQLTEQGLAWFWTDKQKSKEKNGLYTLIGAVALVKSGAGVWTLAPATVGIVATLSVDYYKKNTNLNQWQQLGRLIAAKVYLQAHMDYDKCIADNSSDTAFKTKFSNEKKNYKAILAMIDQQVADYYDAQAQANTGVMGGNCVTGKKWTDYTSAAFWISKALCGIIELIGDIADWLTTTLFQSVFDAYHPPNLKIAQFLMLDSQFIGKASAATADALSPLSKALTKDSGQWPWVIDVWKFVLGLTDLLLVVILLFIGVVNILHIQYDTYAIKKMLPLLIIGVILANFSLLIVRMLIDASNVLTNSLMGGVSPGTMVSELITRVKLTDTSPGFFEAWTNVGILLVGTFFAVFAMAAFLILGVMFYIRYVAILLLAVAAPLAFVSMAFPPTQSLFKQWWSWTTKFVFMKPIAFFLLYFALKVKDTTSTTSIVGWMVITILVYAAILVPWKLGGAVMGMWGGAMGSIFGTKKGGWARKPTEEWWGRRKDLTGASVKARFPGLFKGAEKDRQMVEAMKKTADNKIKNRAMGGNNKLAQLKARAQVAEDKAKELEALQQLGVSTGSYDPMLGLKPIKSKRKFLQALKLSGEIRAVGATLQRATKGIEKDKAFATLLELGQDMEDGNRLAEELEEKFQVMTKYTLDEHGRLVDSGSKTHYGDVKKLADEARLRSHTEANPEIQKNLRLSSKMLDEQARNFENQHRDLNFEAYLNRNLNGRQIALLWPIVNDEMTVNSTNESRQSLNEMVFGKRNAAGGYEKEPTGGSGDIRYYGLTPMQNWVRGNHGKVNFSEKSAINFALGGYKMRMLGNSPDAQDMTADFIEGMSNEDMLGPDFWHGYLQDIEKGRAGSLRSLLKEYNKDAKKRKGKLFGITEEIEPPNIDSHFNEMSDKDIMNVVSPDILREMNTEGYQATEQRYILRQVKSKVAYDKRFGGGKNVILAIADIKNEGDQGGGQTTPSTGPQTPQPSGPASYQYPAPAPVQQVADALQTSTPEQIANQYGNYSNAFQDIYDFSKPVNPLMITENFRAGLAQKLIPDNLKIDLSIPEFDQLIERLSNLNVNLSHEQVEADLKTILPEAKLDSKIPISTYINNAQKVKRSQENLAIIGEGAGVEQTEVYARAVKDQNINTLNENISALEHTTAALLGAMSKIDDWKHVDLDVLKAPIENAAQTLQNARGGGIPLNTENLKNDPVELSSTMNKLIVALKAARYFQSSTTKNDADWEIALKRAVNEGITEGMENALPPTPTTPSAPAVAAEQIPPNQPYGQGHEVPGNE